MKNWLAIFSFALFLGCAGLVIDPSISAVEANDYTLVMQVCDGPMYSGMGVCRVKEGSPVGGAWHIILPPIEGKVKGGEVRVIMRSGTKTFAIPEDGIVIISMVEIFGPKVWSKADNAIANITATVRVEDNTKIEKVLQAEGQAWVRVLPPGYDPMPIDSGYQMWGTTCRVQYSSSGRSAVKCE